MGIDRNRSPMRINESCQPNGSSLAYSSTTDQCYYNSVYPPPGKCDYNQNLNGQTGYGQYLLPPHANPRERSLSPAYAVMHGSQQSVSRGLSDNRGQSTSRGYDHTLEPSRINDQHRSLDPGLLHNQYHLHPSYFTDNINQLQYQSQIPVANSSQPFSYQPVNVESHQTTQSVPIPTHPQSVNSDRANDHPATLYPNDHTATSHSNDHPTTLHSNEHSISNVQGTPIEMINSASMKIMMHDLASAIGKSQTTSQSNLSNFSGDGRRGQLTSWLEEFDIHVAERCIPSSEHVVVLLRHLTGSAKDELSCYDDETRRNLSEVRRILKDKFTKVGSLSDLGTIFGNRDRREGESSDEYSRALIKAYRHMIDTAPTAQNRLSLRDLQDQTLKGRFRRGMNSPEMSVEMRRLELDVTVSFNEMRDKVAQLFSQYDEEIPLAPPTKKTSRVRSAQSERIEGAAAPVTHSHSDDLSRSIQAQQQQLFNLIEGQQQISSNLQKQLHALQLSRNTDGIVNTTVRANSPTQANIPLRYADPVQPTKVKPTKAPIATPSDVCEFCKELGHFRTRCPKVINSTKKKTPLKNSQSQPSENDTAPH